MHTREFTARGRALGAELRAWRERAGLEGVELARMLSWSGTKVSNMESGRRGVSEVDAAMYLACCRTPGTAIEKILEFFHEQQEYWVQPHGLLSDELRSLITLETTAATIQIFEPIVIPGLLQTEDYARSLITSWGVAPEDAIEPLVKARKDRQVLLRRYNPPQSVFFVHENALRTRVGTDAIMNDQLLHLVFASSRPHIDIRVVPREAGPLPGVAGSFTVMAYDRAMPVVYLENYAVSLFLDSPASVSQYREVLARLAAAALDEGQSRSWLAERANEHDRPGENHNELVQVEEPPLA